MKTSWTKFTTDLGIICAYSWCEIHEEYKIKIISKIPKIHYYSVVNQSGEYFDEVIFPTL